MEVLTLSEIKQVSGANGWQVSEDAPNPMAVGYFMGIVHACLVIDELHDDFATNNKIGGQAIMLADSFGPFSAMDIVASSEYVVWDK